MSDVLSNFFSHLKNAQQSRILVIEHTQSKIILAILATLLECGYIRGYRLALYQTSSLKVQVRGKAVKTLTSLSKELQDSSTSPSPASTAEQGGAQNAPACPPAGEDRARPTKGTKNIEILLKYKNQKPAINKITRISKPSKRIYLSVKELSSSLQATKTSGGLRDKKIARQTSENLSPLLFIQGIFVLSTSRGIMSHLTAYRLNVGGEVLCHIS